MIECIITSSVLIVVLISLRFLFLGKISRRLQYALWGLVLLRLLIPFSLFESPLSVMNAVPDHFPSSIQSAEKTSSSTGTVGSSHSLVASETSVGSIPLEKLRSHFPLRQIWLIGSIAVGLWVIRTNLMFEKRLRRVQERYDTVPCKLPICISKEISSPCLFGIFHPTIYLTPKAIENEACVKHVLAHELCHYHHGDHIWSFLRVLCFTAYWWNPLVWAAGYLSKEDSELACDEAVIRQLGEENRLSYGRTLIDMIAIKRTPSALACAATTMSAGNRGIKNRLNMIIKNPKTVIPALIVFLLIVGVCASSTFSGAAAASLSPSEALDQLAVNMVRSDGSVSFQIPKGYERPKSWNIHIAGRLVSDGFSQSVHFMDDITDAKAWEPGKTYTIPLQNGFTELTLTAYLPGENGETMEKSIDLLNLANTDLDACVSNAILHENAGKYLKGDLATEAHTVLKTVEDGDTVTVYASVLYMEFEFSGGTFSDISGCHGPAALTFAKSTDGEYTLTEYWLPKDGSYYAPTIKEKFPFDIYKDALNTQKYILAETQNCYAQAIAYGKVDTDAVLNRLLETICSSPLAASNPGAYIDAHPIEYRELLFYGDTMLRYTYAAFLKGGQTDLRSQIMLTAMRELLGREDLNLSATGTAQAWFDTWKEHAVTLRNAKSIEYMEQNYPKTAMMLKMLN